MIMGRRRKLPLAKCKDPLFYYETKVEYENREAWNKKSRSEETAKAVKSALNTYHIFLMEVKNRKAMEICFDDYSSQNLRQFRDWLTDVKCYKASTTNQRLSLIRGMLEYASGLDDSIMAIYLSAKRIHKLTVPDTPIEYYSEEQMDALLAAPDRSRKIGRRNSMILCLEYDAGLRINELTQLQVKDIYFSGKEPKLMVSGKGATYLPVPLTDKLTVLLKGYMEEFHQDGERTNPLFYGIYSKEKHAISVDTIENIISDCVEVCVAKGVLMPERNHSHMIRKSRAMHLYERGVPLSHIQQILRHKHIDTTSGFYAFATLTMLKASLEKADKAREEGKEKKWSDPDIRRQISEMTR